jgi:hypothetical protein
VSRRRNTDAERLAEMERWEAERLEEHRRFQQAVSLFEGELQYRTLPEVLACLFMGEYERMRP